MMTRDIDLILSLILAILIVSIFPSTLLLYSVQSYGRAEAVRDAVRFLKSSPTFRFDGIPDSIKVETVERISPGRWRVILHFKCRHSGYGDRGGSILLPVITPHRIEIVINRGGVEAAVIDGVWDELHQRPMGN